jgi:hypothetical protein
LTETRLPDDEESQVSQGDMLEARLWEEADPRIFSTSPDDPEEGRTFAWAATMWFERIEDEESGAVEFSPLAGMDEPAVHAWLREQDLEIDELDSANEFGRNVREELLEQNPLYPEAPELSNQEFPAKP